MHICCVVRSSRPTERFSFGLFDGLPVRLCRPYLREAPAGFGLERLATLFMNNPGESRCGNLHKEIIVIRSDRGAVLLRLCEPRDVLAVHR